jgi:membrane fusion protein (multidrug efflux system)
MLNYVTSPSPRARGFGSSASLALLLVALAGCNKHGAAGGPPAAPPPKVNFVTVAPQPVTTTTELPGRTAAVLTADVRPQVSGLILKRLFTEGSEVTEGQQLYQIDPATYQATYDADQATLAHDQAALASAHAKSSRYRPLAAAKAISGQDYDDAVAATKEAEADILSAKANLESAQINLTYTKVKAPISGNIGASSVTPGALVTANQTTALATVTQLDPIYVVLNEPATTLIRLRREMAAGQLQTASDGTAQVTLKLEDGSTYAQPGKLQFSEVTVSETTGTVLVRAIFPNADHLLLPGMFVRAELVEGVNKNGILLPQQAVSHNSHGDPTVYVIGADNKAHLRVIQTGAAVGDTWIVTGGLKAGEHVAIDGFMSIRDNGPVTPVPADSKS